MIARPPFEHRRECSGRQAHYGEEVVSALARQLAAEHGRGFSAKNLRHMVRFAQVFPAEAIVSALRRQLSWMHLKALIYVDDPLKRESYVALPHAGGESVLALGIDRAVRELAPAGWKGDQAREAQVQNALYPILDRDRKATQAVFDIVKNQPRY